MPIHNIKAKIEVEANKLKYDYNASFKDINSVREWINHVLEAIEENESKRSMGNI